MGRSGLSSGTSWMLLTLLLWLPVLTDVLGMEWLLPRLFTLQLACSPSWTSAKRERERCETLNAHSPTHTIMKIHVRMKMYMDKFV